MKPGKAEITNDQNSVFIILVIEAKDVFWLNITMYTIVIEVRFFLLTAAPMYLFKTFSDA
jgi:hypothetical protein